MDEWVKQFLAFVVGGGLMGVLDFVLKLKSSKNDVKRSDFDRALSLIDQLQEDNESLRRNIRELELHYRERDCDILDLRLGILILIEQLRETGVQPRWLPAQPHVREQKVET